MSAHDILSKINIRTEQNSSVDSFKDTADKNYARLARLQNVTTYSLLDNLHVCPRKYQLVKARAASNGEQRQNVDFAYGHGVGAGIQNWIATRNIDLALFNAFLAWRIPFSAAIEKKHKTIWDVTLAVQKYPAFDEMMLGDWEVLVLPNGKPAIELSVSIDFGNGYRHYCHIDVIRKNKFTGQLAVQENKTSGFKAVEEAVYGNSEQALSYAAVIDMISPDTSFEVFYCVYSAGEREWNFLPFTKSTSAKAEWFNDIRLDHATLETYKTINFYPKRGGACFQYMRRCEFYGECNMTGNLPELDTLPEGMEAEPVDFAFHINDMIQRQAERMR